jgi:hypothetical protein
MSTVYQRTIKASPDRLSSEAWTVICALAAPDPKSSARKDLESVAGLAGTIISARYPLEDGIIIYGGGPRVRFYTIYDENAVSGENAKEDKLPSCPTEGDWKLSFPCGKEDLEWLKKTLEGKSKRFSIRALGETVDAAEKDESEKNQSQSSASINTDAFLNG